MNELLIPLIAGLITSVIGGLIANLMTRSPGIKDYFVDTLRSLVESMVEFMNSVITATADNLALPDILTRPLLTLIDVVQVLLTSTFNMIFAVLALPLKIFNTFRNPDLELMREQLEAEIERLDQYRRLLDSTSKEAMIQDALFLVRPFQFQLWL